MLFEKPGEDTKPDEDSKMEVDEEADSGQKWEMRARRRSQRRCVSKKNEQDSIEVEKLQEEMVDNGLMIKEEAQ